MPRPNSTLIQIALCCGSVAAGAWAAPEAARFLTYRPSIAERLNEDWRWRELAAPVPILSDGALVPLPDGGIFLSSNEWVGTYDGYFWRPWPDATLSLDQGDGAAQLIPEGALLYSSNVTLLHRDGGKPHVVANSVPWRKPASCPDGTRYAVRSESLEVWSHDHLEPIGPGPHKTIHAAACGPKNELWISTDHALMVWRDARWQSIPYPSTMPQGTLLASAVASPHRILFLPSPARQVLVALSVDISGIAAVELPAIDGPLHSAALLPHGEIIGVSWTGGLMIRGTDGQWLVVEPSLLERDSVLDLTLTTDERLIVHTVGGRLLSCDLGSNRWQHLSFRHPVLGDAINGIWPARSGGIWIASRSGLIRWREGATRVRFDRVLGVPLDLVTGLLEDDDGSLWVGSGSAFTGVLRLKDGVWERFANPTEVGSLFVHAIRKAPNGSIWFLGFQGGEGQLPQGGVWILDHGRWQPLRDGDRVLNARCYDVVFGADNEPILATRRGLLRRHAGRLEALDEPPQTWFSAFRRSDGTLWFGRGMRARGIRTIPESVALQPSVDAVSSSFAGAFAETPDRRLWFGSLSGLSMFDGTSLHRPSLEPGLESLQIWPVAAAAPEDGGGLWLGSTKSGLYHYSPDDHTAPRTQRVELARANEDGDVRITWEARDAWNVTPPNLLRYRVELDGNPQPGASNTPALELSQMSAGRHLVAIRSVDLSGNDEASPISFEFNVPLPVWRRPAFVGAAGVALMATLLLAATQRQRAKERRSERESHHRALSASEQHFRSLVEQAEIVLIRSDEDGKLRYVSPQIETITGRKAGEFVRRRRLFHHLVHVEDRPQLSWLANARSQRSARTVHADLRVRTAGDTWRRVLVRQSPWIGEDGVIRGFDAVLLDITERRGLEQALTRATKLESLGVMAGGIAHDFNNLLVVIMGNADLARGSIRRGDTPFAELDAIGLAAERAAEVCRQMLTFTGRSPGVRRAVDAVAVIREVNELMRAAVPHSIGLQLDLPNQPLSVMGDATQLNQVVMNLVLNAAEACEGRPGTIRIAARLTTLGSDELAAATLGNGCAPGAFVEIAVADDGQGMDEATQHRIFDPFFSTKFTGRGLGLAAVLGIIRWHQGCISVNSRVGFGTSMHLFLPFAVTSLDRVANVLGADQSGSGTVLVVDDEPLVLETVTSLLRTAGFKPMPTVSASHALEWLAQRTEKPVAAVVDITMPEMDGRELAKAIHRLMPGLPILLLSGYAPDQVAPQSPAQGPMRFLQKPFRREALLDTLLRMLAQDARRG
ncbi:MAG: response regulator [Acidobacteriota bacterium]